MEVLSTIVQTQLCIAGLPNAKAKCMLAVAKKRLIRPTEDTEKIGKD